jgi:DNA adenine methylase
MTVKEAFEGMSPLQIRPRPTARLIQLAPLIKPGERGSRRHPTGQYINCVRLAWDRPAPTLIANAFTSSSLVFHPETDTGISIDEAKRIHSIPDEFAMIGNYRQRWSLIGRSVPPPMMRAIASHVRDQILQTGRLTQPSVLPVCPLTRIWSGQTIRSPLRYCGGKSRAVAKFLLPLLPRQPGVLVSPFVGGASLELSAAALGWQVFAYDANISLVDFWQVLLTDPHGLANAVEKHHPLSRERFYKLQQENFDSQLERAAAFFTLNRASFSGLTRSGGMSPNHVRFTPSSIQRLRDFHVRNFAVQQADYRKSIAAHPDALLLLDPPYLNTKRLYGNRGDLHEGFDHECLRDLLHGRERWILCYGDCPEIRAMYEGYTILPLRWKYGMSNEKDGREIVILSHDLAELHREKDSKSSVTTPGSRSEMTERRYWLTPKGVYEPLDAEFHFDFDPCPCPRPETYNSLAIPWGKSNFVNPPFRRKDGVDGQGPTAFVRKAIQEQKQGKTSVLIIPVQSYVNLLLEAGAELRSLGRVRWLEATTGEPCKSPSPICCFILRPNDQTTKQRIALEGPNGQ